MENLEVRSWADWGLIIIGQVLKSLLPRLRLLWLVEEFEAVLLDFRGLILKHVDVELVLRLTEVKVVALQVAIECF